MVVRDDQGNILNPEVTSTLELFHHHELATDRIRKATVNFQTVFSHLNWAQNSN